MVIAILVFERVFLIGERVITLRFLRLRFLIKRSSKSLIVRLFKEVVGSEIIKGVESVILKKRREK